MQGNFLVAKKEGTNEYVPVLLDFGLTKRAKGVEVLALSKILLAAQSMDFTSMQAGLQELGLKGLTADIDAEKSMEVIQFIFRRTTSQEEARAEMAERRKKREEEEAANKEAQKAKGKDGSDEERKKDVNKKPADAIPGVLVFFSRVLHLLRGEFIIKCFDKG
jgi:hypothetical protein